MNEVWHTRTKVNPTNTLLFNIMIYSNYHSTTQLYNNTLHEHNRYIQDLGRRKGVLKIDQSIKMP